MSTSRETPAGKYLLGTYYKSKKRKNLPCTPDEFLKSVEAAVFLQDPTIDLDQFFAAIDNALVTDRELKRPGYPPAALANLPEYKIFEQAIRDAIDDQELRHKTKKTYKSLPEDHEGPPQDPSAWVIIAEQANAVREAMKMVTDPLDRKIVKLRFFHPNCNTNVKVAAKIGRPPKFVARRLENIFQILRDKLQDFEPN